MPEEIESPQRITRLTPLDEVLASIQGRVKAVVPRSADLASALDRTLADDIAVEQPMPEAALALRDGWALRSDFTTDASSYAPAPIPAAVRIETGQPLPSDADAVALSDTVAMCAAQAQALSPVAPGEGVLAAGADLATGAVLLPAGRQLRPLHVALLALSGVASVTIREPRLRIARARPRPDSMIDAAIENIEQAVRCGGGRLVKGEMHAPLSHALTQADADAVIVVGGTGCGRNDNTVATLATVGEVQVHGIALTPGETAGFGMAGDQPVLLLPGRLDAALAVWHMLGRVMLARLAANAEQPCMRRAKLTRKVSSNAGLSELVAVRCEGLFANPLASGYAPISALAQANGWLLVPSGSEGYQAESEVMIRPWP
jgi:molybdopterin biosynthesis enzyme